MKSLPRHTLFLVVLVSWSCNGADPESVETVATGLLTSRCTGGDLSGICSGHLEYQNYLSCGWRDTCASIDELARHRHGIDRWLAAAHASGARAPCPEEICPNRPLAEDGLGELMGVPLLDPATGDPALRNARRRHVLRGIGDGDNPTRLRRMIQPSARHPVKHNFTS